VDDRRHRAGGRDHLDLRVTFGYSLGFVGDGRWLGTLDRWFLAGMTMDGVWQRPFRKRFSCSTR